jgi:hypothetical protein
MTLKGSHFSFALSHIFACVGTSKKVHREAMLSLRVIETNEVQLLARMDWIFRMFAASIPKCLRIVLPYRSVFGE